MRMIPDYWMTWLRLPLLTFPIWLLIERDHSDIVGVILPDGNDRGLVL